MAGFYLGDVVKGRFTEGVWRMATIEQVHADDTYTVAWFGSDTSGRVMRPQELKLISASRARQVRNLRGKSLTWERAQLIPQVDRLSKKAVWEILQGVESPWLMPKDITDGSILRWWLWIGNLGAHSRDVIGPGVTGARVSMADDGNSATFTFDRTDGSSSHVVLSCSRRQQLDIRCINDFRIPVAGDGSATEQSLPAPPTPPPTQLQPEVFLPASEGTAPDLPLLKGQ